jgi:hypothetical protein
MGRSAHSVRKFRGSPDSYSIGARLSGGKAHARLLSRAGNWTQAVAPGSLPCPRAPIPRGGAQRNGPAPFGRDRSRPGERPLPLTEESPATSVSLRAVSRPLHDGSLRGRRSTTSSCLMRPPLRRGPPFHQGVSIGEIARRAGRNRTLRRGPAREARSGRSKARLAFAPPFPRPIFPSGKPENLGTEGSVFR